jgi:serine/threonine protein kinase
MKLPQTFTPGFASPEQHVDREVLGPWSDIYSVGASMYACLGNALLQPADQRLKDDKLGPARRVWDGKYSHELLETVDWCMQLHHLDRPQSVFVLQKALRA